MTDTDPAFTDAEEDQIAEIVDERLNRQLRKRSFRR
jgi:hypothetical protein